MSEGVLSFVDYLEGLNQEQRLAVETTEGPLLVLAGAGSGKTRVVTYRIVYLLQQGVEPQAILGLTFTNKAASEMKERVHSLTEAFVLVSTFHSLGARILRESIHHLGYTTDFTIYDDEDKGKVVKEVLSELGLPDKKASIKEMKSWISDKKNALQAPDPFADLPEERVYDRYQEKLKECNACDFDDLLFLPVTLFQTNDEVLAMYQERWHYLMIDEYQDTNQAQYQFIQSLVALRGNLCVVGDPDQSIYSWRGANVHNILNFEKDYPQALVIRLEQNYRSSPTILEAANHLIQHNEERLHKNLWSQKTEGEKLKVFTAEDEREEAYFVANTIDTLQRKGYTLDQIVVFYRTNAQSRVLEDTFLAENLPYQIIGGVSFYQRREIKDLLAFLRMLHSDRDLVAFLRTINLPKRGLGPSTLAKLQQAAQEAKLPILATCRKIVQQEISFKLTPKQKKGLTEYVQLIDSLRYKEGRLSDQLTALLHQSGYLALLKEDKETYDDRKENVDALLAKVYEWEEEHEEPSWEGFLEEISLRSSVDEHASNVAKISLMTLHNGKGLEFPVVFLVGLEETLFPHINSLGNPQMVEEERRLCYVGITRAEETLYLTSARRRNLFGSYRFMTPSRFLRELPLHLMERVRR